MTLDENAEMLQLLQSRWDSGHKLRFGFSSLAVSTQSLTPPKTGHGLYFAGYWWFERPTKSCMDTSYPWLPVIPGWKYGDYEGLYGLTIRELSVVSMVEDLFGVVDLYRRLKSE